MSAYNSFVKTLKANRDAGTFGVGGGAIIGGAVGAEVGRSTDKNQEGWGRMGRFALRGAIGGAAIGGAAGLIGGEKGLDHFSHVAEMMG